MAGLLKRILQATMIMALISSSLCQMEDPCTTPDNTPGNCIVLSNCKSLYSELQSATNRNVLIKIHAKLKKHNCGYEKFDPKVCCPFEPIDIETTSDRIAIVSKIDPILPPDVTNHPNIGLLPKECGPYDENDRITKGQKTQLNEFPWMVLIAYNMRGENSFRCGGSIINSRYILTAAHCVTGPNTENLSLVRIGEHNLTTAIDCKGPSGRQQCAMPVKDIAVSEKIPHPSYSRTKLTDDIALLRLEEPIDFQIGNADSICLPVTKYLREFNLENHNVTVAGWGVTENGTSSSELLKVTLPIVSNAQCNEVFKKSVPSGITNKQLCAGGMNGQDSCSGDSGGPLKILYDAEDQVTRYVQHGIVSFGSKQCGSVGVPGVYTRIAYYMDWILDQIKP